MKILCVLVSPFGENSVSRSLAQEALSRLSQVDPESQLRWRDLGATPPPHWGARQIQAAFTAPDQRSREDQEALRLSDTLCQELLEADLLLVATPMWNFGVPSSLKSWIDHVARVGVTFKYEEGAPKGLLHRLKKVLIIESSGGDIPTPMNHVAPYLEQVFGFLGVGEVRTLSAQGTAINRTEALERARRQLVEWSA